VNHTYTVETLNNAAASAQSASVTAMMYAAMPQVTGLTLTAQSGGIVAAWNAVPHATSYKLYRGITAGTLVVIDVGLIGTAVFDAVSADQPYYYAVAAVGPCGEGPASAVLSATALPPPLDFQDSVDPSPTDLDASESVDRFSDATEPSTSWMNNPQPPNNWN
jgi:hypothetical protein